MGAAALLVPVKDFRRAKLRLSPVLDDAARMQLARSLATRVLEAADGLDAFVVCDDHDVRAWAEGRGAEVIWAPGRGLDGAVHLGVEHLSDRGITRAVVSHADLPLARAMPELADFPGVTLVPDRFGDGTNVACVPTGGGFRFAYGPGSFGRHADEARRLGLSMRIVRDRRLSWDVDRPRDLTLPPDLAREVPLPRPDPTAVHG
jgi:2-phospho-L-lactate guanylyltransferase